MELSRIRHDADASPELSLGPGPWWESLREDFCEGHEQFVLESGDRMRVGATAGSDVVLRSAAASMVGSLALPLGYTPRKMRAALEDVPFYLPMAASGDPSQFFKEPPRGVRVRAEKANWYPRFDPDDGVCETLRFDSPFMPVNPRLHRKYLRNKQNRVAHARYWRHHGKEARPTIVAVHGFAADLYVLNEWYFALPWFYRMGCDVALFTLPFHGSRQGRLSPFSGHGFFAGGPSHLNEAVAQSVMDFRILLRWLKEERGAPAVGVAGVSLGGFTSAILAGVEKGLAFSIPSVPVITLPDLVSEWEPVGTTLRTVLRVTGRTLVDARKLIAVSCPLTYNCVLPKEHRLIVGGVGDRLAPPKHSRVLWEHWERCDIHWFPGSHLVHLDRGRYLDETAHFLKRIDFLPDLDA